MVGGAKGVVPGVAVPHSAVP